MTTQEQIVLDPQAQAFVDALAAKGGKPIYQLSYKDAARFSRMRKRSRNEAPGGH